MSSTIPDNFLKDESRRLASLKFQEGRLQVLDQLKLPHEFEYIDVAGVDDAFHVIKTMKVRGAPLIAVVGCLGLFLELKKIPDVEFVKVVREKIAYLITSRPTAVDLRNALNSILPLLDEVNVRERVEKALINVYECEKEANRRLVWNGYRELVDGKEDHQLTVMTICNTGSLATCSWGTALGVIRALHSEGRLKMCYALETRPYNQGSRLTASELVHGGVPFKLITDSMAAAKMKSEKIDAVLTGADCVALNGDTANKIGTYMLAVLAKYHHVAFYPVVPSTSINKRMETGDDIVIEERPAEELLTFNGVLTAPKETKVWNPAFDVTPAHLITKIVTDFGCFAPQDLKNNIY